MSDIPEMAARRRAMVALQLAARGIRDEQVLSAMSTVPREAFVAEDQRETAYDDRALPAGHSQTISQPYIVAFMSQVLQAGRFHRVLEVGTGTGYQTMILAALCGEVFTLERIAALSSAAQARLAALGVRGIQFRVADGALGWPEEAPFDRIIVTAAHEDVPSALIEQLAVGGRLVMPVGMAEDQRLVLVERRPHRLVETPLIWVRFVPLISTGTGQERLSGPAPA